MRRDQSKIEFQQTTNNREDRVPTNIGPMKGSLSVGRRLEILLNVSRRLGNETVSVGLKWSVKCRVTNFECRCQATSLLG